MPSRLSKVLTVVSGRLPAIPDLKIVTGWRELARQSKPPRLVWVPGQDTFGPATQYSNPRPVMTRFAGVEAHCWGVDEQEAEELAHQVLLALYLTLESNLTLQINSGTWLTQDLKNAGDIKLGEVYVISFVVGIPVVEGPWLLAPVDAIAYEPTLNVHDDGVLESGEE